MSQALVSKATSLALPAFSGPLERRMEGFSSADPEARDRATRYSPPPTPAMISEARAVVHRFAAALRPPTRDALIAWARPINAAVRNPQGEQDFLIRVSAWAVMLADIPGACLTLESQRDALRLFQFWPSAADVFALLNPEAARLRRVVAALGAIAAPASPAPMQAPREPPTTEELTAVSALVAKLTAETRAHSDAHDEAQRAQKSIRAAPVFSRETLTALYVREGIKPPMPIERSPTP